MTIDITDKVGIFRGVDYVPKSLQRNNPLLEFDHLTEYEDRYCFEVILILDCQNCNFAADYSRTWESQPENWEALRTHFVENYKIIIDLRKRMGQIASQYENWYVDEPESGGIFHLRKEDVPLDTCILDFVDENKRFFREEIKNPPKIPKNVLRYIVTSSFYD